MKLKDKVIVGMAGAEFGIRGFIQAHDAETGKPVWKFYTVAGPGEPGGNTWPQGTDAYLHGGGSIWAKVVSTRRLRGARHLQHSSGFVAHLHRIPCALPADCIVALADFGRLPTLVNGRVKPLDTVARTTLLVLQGLQARDLGHAQRALVPADSDLDQCPYRVFALLSKPHETTPPACETYYG